MTCKDCYYFNICDSHAIDKIPEWNGRAEEICQRFNDKNKIIELPCNIDDKIYFLGNRVIEATVKDISIFKMDGTFQVSLLCIYEQEKQGSGDWAYIDINWTAKCGKTAFRTKSEAEKEWREIKR